MDITLVAPAAGRGTRLPGRQIPKGMLRVCGIPILEYVLKAGMELPISRIVIIINQKGEAIREYFRDSYRGVPIHYVIQPEPQGLVHAVSLAEAFVRDWFLVVNGDEIFDGCRHREMPAFVAQKQAHGLVGYMHTRQPRRIQIGYGMNMDSDGRVKTLVEKPQTPWNDILGVGTWLHRADFFDYFRRTPVNPQRGERDFVSVIQLMADDGQRIFGFDVEGQFFNVNTPADLENAEAALSHQLTAVSGAA